MSNDLLSKDAILAADDTTYEELPVPEWGGTVRVKSLTGTQRDAFEVSISTDGKTKNLENVRARLVAKTVVDKDGKTIFTDKDVVKLGLKNAAALNRVWELARRLSGLTEEDVDELVSDFDDDPSEPSTSD